MAKTSESGVWGQDPPVRAFFVLSCCLHERHTVAYVYLISRCPNFVSILRGWLGKWTIWVDVWETDAEFEAGSQDKDRA